MLILGIDTGGTYTDGVLLDRDTGQVLCKGKALTTHEDLSQGIEACIQELALLSQAQIELVCLSTTLATNAVVEGKGGRTGLLLLGAVPDGPLPVEEYFFLPASVDLRGNIREPLNDGELERVLLEMEGRYEALAVSGYAGIRNPKQEQQVKEWAEQRLNIPVVCGCELTGALGFYQRTVTAVLNARLIPIVQHLIDAVKRALMKIGVHAPVMILRGDGSLMKASYAEKRPVETILSGPAASVTGARFLSGRQDCLIVDMGGTTTDVAEIRGGRCCLTREGATVGGWKTRVQAMEIHSYGLGGDSWIREGKKGEWDIGPDRVIPYSRQEFSRESKRTVGLTPTDILHVTGEYVQWNPHFPEAALLQLAQKIGTSTRQLTEDLEQEIVGFLWRCCSGSAACIVGVGAPAQTWLQKLSRVLDAKVEIPPHFEVANAVGAAAGEIWERSEVLIRRRRADDKYYVYTERDRLLCDTLKQAEEVARQAARSIAAEKARWAGASDFEIEDSMREILDLKGFFIECRLTAEAHGYPGEAFNLEKKAIEDRKEVN